MEVIQYVFWGHSGLNAVYSWFEELAECLHMAFIDIWIVFLNEMIVIGLHWYDYCNGSVIKLLVLQYLLTSIVVCNDNTLLVGSGNWFRQ